MKDISNNVKTVIGFFLICFIFLITYMIYFGTIKASNIEQSPYNRRLWAKREEVIRGSILDKNNNILAETKLDKNENYIRVYPYHDLFAHIVGYIRPKIGLTGLEKSLDKYLIGEEPFSIIDALKGLGDEKGYSVITTLDCSLQQKANDLLENNKGSVVVLNPQTGEILAIVSNPTYDPMELTEKWSEISTDENKPLFNRALSGLYPPGSTFKIITTASALENIEGVENQTFDDTGIIKFNESESISNYKDKIYGSIDLREAFTLSSNVVFGNLGLELGNNKLKSIAENFYFNKEIPLDFLEVKNSIFPSLSNNEMGEIAQSAIGQSQVLATPFEMAIIASTIANDGILKKPYILSQVIDENGKTLKKISNTNLGKIISSTNAGLIKEYMNQVVEVGTGKNAGIENITVCGKTGTAEYTSDSDRTHSWFVGFAPMENPEVAIAVIVEDGGTGGGTAATIAREVIKIAIK